MQMYECEHNIANHFRVPSIDIATAHGSDKVWCVPRLKHLVRKKHLVRNILSFSVVTTTTSVTASHEC